VPLNPIDVGQAPAPQLPDESPAQIARRRFLLWGAGGVLLGATLSAGISALSFRSYRKTGSVLAPALWAGAGSLVVGGTLLLMFSRAIGQPLDQRVLALAAGAQFAK